MKTYQIIHSSCDGADAGPVFETFEAARAEADRLQTAARATGNPYAYRYTVYGPYGREVYRT
jgi:hypothetical protein